MAVALVPSLMVVVHDFFGDDLWALAIGLGAGAFLLALWLTWTFPWHGAYFTAVRNLYRDLPWFKAATVNFVHPSHRRGLEAALVRERFVIHDIDGGTIGSLADLTQALTEQFGPMTHPRDPYRRAAAMLARVVSPRREHHAFLWHGEHVIVAHNQGEQDLFLAAWQRLVRKEMPHVLLFLITPDAPED